ncbi:MAG: methyltransferase domain-containing protein [Nanoarchaeota archaeon]
MKIHLGCGKRFLKGYVHVDLDKHEHIDYYHDIKTLPMFPDNSADEIYSCGTFEYFDRITEVPNVLAEWKRVLKQGGVIRMSVPDFEGIAKVYQKYHDVDGKGILGPIFGRIEIETERGREILYHKTVYDYDSLKKVLESAGFTNVARYDWRSFFPSGYDDFSAAYIPHMDPKGIPLGLNLVCIKSHS